MRPQKSVIEILVSGSFRFKKSFQFGIGGPAAISA